MQKGDVPVTFADIDPLIEKFDIKPKTNIDDGIKSFVKWFLESK